MNRGILEMKLYSLSKVYNENGDVDPTLMKATFIILELDAVSGNKQVITKEEGLKMSPTMKLKPLTCQYFKTTNYDTPNDHFGSHGAYKEKFRIGGQEFIATNSFAIGVAPEGCRLETIDKDGTEVEVLMCDYMLWMSRYPNIVSLIDEMHTNGITLNSSCEYLYSNYEVKDGITYPKDLIFDGHCLLGQKPDGTEVQPAFDVSKLISLNEKWNKAISEVVEQDKQLKLNKSSNEDLNINNDKEDEAMAENKFYKALCELSHGDIRQQIMTILYKTMTAEEFEYCYVSSYGIFDNYFIYENYEADNYVNYKVPYSKTETEVTVDLSQKVQVQREGIWTEMPMMVQVQNSLNEANTKIGELETSLNEKDTTIGEKDETIKTLNSTIETLTTEKEDVASKFNSATDTITELTKQINEMKPIVEEHNKEQYQKALNEQINKYSEKFIALNAKEKFESEEVQELIKKSLNSNEEGTKAILDLNTMIVDMVQIGQKKEEKTIKEFNSKLENLIPTSNSFEDRYMVK